MSEQPANRMSGAGPHVALLAVQVIFGTWPVMGKIALRAVPSTGLVAIRVGGAAVAFMLLLGLRGRLLPPDRRDLARLALYSLLGGDTMKGNLLLVANTACYGAYLAVSKDVFRRYGALTAMTWLFAIGSLAAVPFGGYYLAQTDFAAVGWVVWLVV